MCSFLARLISSDQNTWPGRVVMRPSISLASRGARASGIARLFEETRTNPDWVTGQVANPDHPTTSNQAIAAVWWKWFGPASATRTLTSRRIGPPRGRRRTSEGWRETGAGLRGASGHSSSTAKRTISEVRGEASAGTSNVGKPRWVPPAGKGARTPLRASSEMTIPRPLPREAARLLAAR